MRTPNGELYNYTIVEKLDESGNSYLEHENDFEQPIASTYRERVQAIKKTTDPFVGKQLNNKLIEDMWRTYYHSDTPVLYNSLDETPFDGFLYHFINFETPEYLEKMGYDYFSFEVGGKTSYIQTADSFCDANDISKPLIFSYGEGWSMILKNMYLSLVAGLLLVITLAGTVFSGEYRYRMIGQMLSTKNGRQKLFASKIVAMLLVTILIYGIIWMFNILLCGSLFGLEGFKTNMTFIGASQFYFYADLSDTIGELVLRYGIVGFVVYCTVSLITMVFSSLFENELSSTILAVLIFMTPALFISFFITMFPEKVVKFLRVLPPNIFQIRQTTTNAEWTWTTHQIGEVPLWIIISTAYIVVTFIGVIFLMLRAKSIQDK